MSQNSPCNVGALGLPEHEIRLLKSILRISNERGQTRYEWTEDQTQAHVLMVSTDNEPAIKAWQEVARKNPAAVLLLLTQNMQQGSAEYSVSRPMAPSKILLVLDKILKEKLSLILAPKIFAGEDKSEQREAIKVAQGVGLSARSALVVDDSPTVRKQLELELGSYDVKVYTAETGEQCLDMLEKDRYDIIFLDVVLPGTDGYEVCKNIRKNQLTKHTPVIMLTSKSSSFDRVRGALAGCSAYLTKPVDYEKFHKVLGEYLIQGQG